MTPAKIEELRELRAMWEAAPDGSVEKGLLGFRLMGEAFEALPHFLAAASQGDEGLSCCGKWYDHPPHAHECPYAISGDPSGEDAVECPCSVRTSVAASQGDEGLREALRAFGQRLSADGYGWEAIITREGPNGEETVAHLTTANPDATALADASQGDERLRGAIAAMRSPRNSLGKLALPKGLMERAVEAAWDGATSSVGNPEDGIEMHNLAQLADGICDFLDAALAAEEER